MKLRTVLMGAVASLTMAPAAFAERGSDGQLGLIMWQAPTTMHPYLSGGTKEVIASSLTLEPLAGYDAKGTIYPRLAAELPSLENGGIAEDMTSVTWKLRDDIKWSDGTPFTADDVVFTANYCMDPDGGCSQLAKFEGIKTIEAVDAHTGGARAVGGGEDLAQRGEEGEAHTHRPPRGGEKEAERLREGRAGSG